MKARLVVFPIKGRKWCFARSVDPAAADSQAAHTPSTLRDLWNRISSNPKPLNANAELLLDFASNKMNKAWGGLEKAPEGTLKNKLYGLGLRLLARVKPSEIFLKSISKEVSKVHVAYPSRSRFLLFFSYFTSTLSLFFFFGSFSWVRLLITKCVGYSCYSPIFFPWRL